MLLVALRAILLDLFNGLNVLLALLCLRTEAPLAVRRVTELVLLVLRRTRAVLVVLLVLDDLLKVLLADTLVLELLKRLLERLLEVLLLDFKADLLLKVLLLGAILLTADAIFTTLFRRSADPSGDNDLNLLDLNDLVVVKRAANL